MSRAELSKEELSKGKPSFRLNVDRRVATGMVLVVFGTVCFAAKSIFIHLAYEKGANPEATLLLRQLFATPLFWVLFMVNRNKLPVIYQRRDMLKACIAGLLCFFLSPLLDFIGLHDVSAIVERMLLMSYPVFVIIFSAYKQKRMIPIQNLVAILVIYTRYFSVDWGMGYQFAESEFQGRFFNSTVICGLRCLSRTLWPFGTQNWRNPDERVWDDNGKFSHVHLHDDKNGIRAFHESFSI